MKRISTKNKKETTNWHSERKREKKSIGPFESLLLLFSIQPGCDCGALVESSSFSGLVAVVRPAPAVRLPHSSSPHFEWRNKLINNNNITIKKEEEEKKTSEKKQTTK